MQYFQLFLFLYTTLKDWTKRPSFLPGLSQHIQHHTQHWCFKGCTHIFFNHLFLGWWCSMELLSQTLSPSSLSLCPVKEKKPPSISLPILFKHLSSDFFSFSINQFLLPLSAQTSCVGRCTQNGSSVNSAEALASGEVTTRRAHQCVMFTEQMVQYALWFRIQGMESWHERGAQGLCLDGIWHWNLLHRLSEQLSTKDKIIICILRKTKQKAQKQGPTKGV